MQFYKTPLGGRFTLHYIYHWHYGSQLVLHQDADFTLKTQHSNKIMNDDLMMPTTKYIRKVFSS